MLRSRCEPAPESAHIMGAEKTVQMPADAQRARKVKIMYGEEGGSGER